MVNDGGPAFPQMALHPTSNYFHSASDGMSLRDYFAGQVLAALLADEANITNMGTARDNLPNFLPITTFGAKTAYQWADAMLEAREES